MPGKYEAPRGSRRRRRRRKNPILPILIIVILLLAALAGGVILLLGRENAPNTDPAGSTAGIDAPVPTETTTAPTETEPVPIHVTSTATIATTGDLLMHLPVVNAHTVDGVYDFTRAFQYLAPYASGADFAIANLETTLAGLGNGYAYSGYPCFNCPDEIVDAALDAGFDLLLTANNHTYDTRTIGLNRTLQVLQEKGMLSLGTVAGEDDANYVVQQINEIRVGMVCYTYETADGDPNLVSLNTIPVSAADAQRINTFNYALLDEFYAELQSILDAMEAEGAEATMVFIHWGDEYQLTPNDSQKAIAQKLCDMGVDVIVGGHPHVVEPVELLTSTLDEDQKTVCVYSVGNALSNQSRNTISRTPQGHCEDGMLFSVTFSKYSDGTVALEGVELLPTWVNWFKGQNKYNILPLDLETRDQWQTLYNLSDNEVGHAVSSYDRTMAIVGEGLQISQDYLASMKQQREEMYLQMAMNGES